LENKSKFFMHAYMYELERFLGTQKDEISKVSLWLDEANADRELKVYFKKLIESVFNKIPSDTDIKGVVIEGIGKCDIAHLQNIFITRVLLPEDISDQIKGALGRSKGRVYTNPDICLEISIDGKLHYEPVELKTTKKDAIPAPVFNR